MTLVLVTLTLLFIAALASAEKLPNHQESAYMVGGVRGNGAAPQTTEGNRLASAGDQAGTTAAGHSGTSTIDYYKRLAAKRLRLLSAREHRIVHLLNRLRGGDARGPASAEQRRSRKSTGVSGGVKGVICSVFGAHCSEALRVAWCESRLNVYARNGQYLGLFQEGEFARSHYGFGWTASAQAESAYRYFLDAGWSPWACKP
jgi:hypothetical protein